MQNVPSQNDIIITYTGEGPHCGALVERMGDTGRVGDPKLSHGKDLEALMFDVAQAFTDYGYVAEWWALPRFKAYFGEDFDPMRTWITVNEEGDLERLWNLLEE